MAVAPVPIALTLLALILVIGALSGVVQSGLARRFSWWAIPLTTGWIGVPVHELSHAVACLLLRRPILKFRPLAPNSQTGTLGFVQWQPGAGPLAWLSTVLVGLAPLAGGTLALFGLMQLPGVFDHCARLPHWRALPWSWQQDEQTALPTLDQLFAMTHVYADLTRRAWQQGWTGRLGIVAWWWSLVSVAAHMSPSSADLRDTWRGWLLGLLLTAAVLLGWHALDWHGHIGVLNGIFQVMVQLIPGLLVGGTTLMALVLILLPLRR